MAGHCCPVGLILEQDVGPVRLDSVKGPFFLRQKRQSPLFAGNRSGARQQTIQVDRLLQALDVGDTADGQDALEDLPQVAGLLPAEFGGIGRPVGAEELPKTWSRFITAITAGFMAAEGVISTVAVEDFLERHGFDIPPF
jgi:hypothetical protein